MPKGSTEATGAGMSKEARFASLGHNKRVGESLRGYRSRRGWSQTRMAEHLSQELGTPVSVMAVSGWERGTRTVPAVVVLACRPELLQAADLLR